MCVVKTFLAGFKDGLNELFKRSNVPLKTFDRHPLALRHVHGSTVKNAHHALTTLHDRVVKRLGFSNLDMKVKQRMKAT